MESHPEKMITQKGDTSLNIVYFFTKYMTFLLNSTHFYAYFHGDQLLFFTVASF